MSRSLRLQCKSRHGAEKTKVEDRSLPIELSVEWVFSKLITHLKGIEPIGRPDEHLTGIYFSIVEGNYFQHETGFIQLLDFGRFFRKVKTCSLNNDRKKFLRDSCKRKEGRSLYMYKDHPHFKECFRFRIGNFLVGHIRDMNCVHALYLAFAVCTTSKLLAVSLSHSYRAKKGFKQGEMCPMTLLFLYYQKLLKHNEAEKDVVKQIKISLCTEFSIQADQELPEGHEISFRIFPESIRNHLKKQFETREEKLRFYFSVLQSKALCREVSDDMVMETLAKHRKTLCEGETRKLDNEFKAELVSQGKRLGRYLRNHYNPFMTSKAPVSASYSYSRKKNGVLGELIDKDMVLNHSNYLIGDPCDRCEPLVIGIFGEPATGKSVLVQELISELQQQLFSNFNLKNVSYSRSCSMKHWDGYTGQPIVVLDDFGQSSDRLDVVEFQQLVSCNPYQLPMAELSEKGVLFNSPIIILTSNMGFGISLSTQNTPNPVEDNLAFWRRIHLPVVLGHQGRVLRDWIIHEEDHIIATDSLSHILTPEEKALFIDSKGSRISGSNEAEKRFFPPCCSSEYRNPRTSRVPNSRVRRPSSDPVDFYCFSKWKRSKISYLVRRLSLNHREFFLKKTSKYWTQTVSSENVQVQDHASGVKTELILPLTGENHSVSYRFPRHPPKGKKRLLPVRVEPIKEPLKVRTITAGIAETRCLKPLQKCMWDFLGTQPQFRLTHGTKFLERSVWNCRSIEQSDPKLQEALDLLKKQNPETYKLWISGDYESATDNFILECGAIILEEALSFIDHEPTKEWALKEMSSHLLVYPKDSGLRPGVQKNGQLMGSLLSFPLLCLVNDSTARLAGAKKSEYLINGDDILMRVRHEIGERWKQIAPLLGLKLSIGKTFSDPRFGTVNSQLFYDGSLLPTGKIKTCSRRTQVLGETYRDFQRFHKSSDDSNLDKLKKLYLRLNRPQLSKTFESLCIPMSHGGLGLVKLPQDNPRRREQDFLVYLTKLLKKLNPIKGSLKLPFFGMSDGFRKSNIRGSLEVPEEFDWEEGVSGAEMNQSARLSRRNPKLRDVIDSLRSQDIDIMDLPDLDFIQVREVQYVNPDYRERQQGVTNRFIGKLLDVNLLRAPVAQTLLERFRCMKKQQVLDSLGVIDDDPIEIPDSELLHGELVPEIMCCERLWSDLFLGTFKLSNFDDLKMPEIKISPPFSRPIPDIDESEFTHGVDFCEAYEITKWDVVPSCFETVPEFEVVDSGDFNSLLDNELSDFLGDPYDPYTEREGPLHTANDVAHHLVPST